MTTAPFAAASAGFASAIPTLPYDAEIGCACGYGAPCECNDSDPPDTKHVTVVVEAALH
jgi:hypothetical protein